MNALVGYTGFIGSYLRTKLSGVDLYNSVNIREMSNKSYDTVYFCGMPATKWLANLYPGKDLENLELIKQVLSSCNARRFVLISTIDVYDIKVAHQNEDAEAYTAEPYGFNRRALEVWACSNFEKVHVLRLPALFGIGLKKNALYDLLTDNKACKVNPLDSFQWYCLEDLWEDIGYVIENDIPVINLFSEPVQMKDVLKMFVLCDAPVTRPPISYDIRTKYSVTTYIKDKKRVLEQMSHFIELWKCLASARDRLVVSNLCWTNEERALALLKRYGIFKLEIAVTACQCWNDPTDAIKKRYSGFDVYSMQALFYGIDSNIFEDSDGFLNHWRTVARIAKELGAKRLVFGSPKNRLVPEGMSAEEARGLFVAAFRKMSEMLDDSTVCIEHNAPEYGCNFVKTVDEAIDVVNEIDRPNVMVNLDTGNAEMTGCDIGKIPGSVGHIQVSYPFLGPIEREVVLGELVGYKGMISMECRGLTPEGFESSLERFVLSVGAGLRAP